MIMITAPSHRPDPSVGRAENHATKASGRVARQKVRLVQAAAQRRAAQAVCMRVQASVSSASDVA